MGWIHHVLHINLSNSLRPALPLVVVFGSHRQDQRGQSRGQTQDTEHGERPAATATALNSESRHPFDLTPFPAFELCTYCTVHYILPNLDLDTWSLHRSCALVVVPTARRTAPPRDSVTLGVSRSLDDPLESVQHKYRTFGAGSGGQLLCGNQLENHRAGRISTTTFLHDGERKHLAWDTAVLVRVDTERAGESSKHFG